MTASTPQNKARTFLAAHGNEKQQIRTEEPIITIILFTVSQFTVWHVNAEQIQLLVGRRLCSILQLRVWTQDNKTDHTSVSIFFSL